VIHQKAKELDNKITQKQVKDFLKRQSTAQITKPIRKSKNEYNTIISPSVRNNYQMDLMILPNPTLNKNFKYLLTCIDVYSRYAFCVALKNKTGETVYDNIKILFHMYGKPNNLNLDVGSEFIYTPFVNYCETNSITLFYSNPEQDNKNSIIERFHRTLVLFFCSIITPHILEKYAVKKYINY